MVQITTLSGTEITPSQLTVDANNGNEIAQISPVAKFAEFFAKHPNERASAVLHEYDNASALMREFVLRELQILQTETEKSFGEAASNAILNRLNESDILTDIMDLYGLKTVTLHYDTVTQKFQKPKIGIVSERSKPDTMPKKSAGKSECEYYINGNYIGNKSISISDHLGIIYDSWHGINRMLEIAKFMKKSNTPLELTREISGNVETFDVDGTIAKSAQQWI